MFKIPANSLRNSIFVRLIATYILVILPIILLGIYLYNWSYANASQEISKNTQSQLTTFLDDLNREIEWLEIQQYDFLQDSELNKLAVTWDMLGSVERKAKMQYLLPRLASIKNSSAYVKDVYVHMRTIDKTISAGFDVQDFQPWQYNEIRAWVDLRTDRLFKVRNSLHLGASKFGGVNDAEPLFVVQIELDTEKLRESLRQISSNPESGTFLYTESSGFALAANAEAKGIMDSYLRSNNKNNNDSTLRIAGVTYLVDQVYSEKLELFAVTYLPVEAVKRPLSKFTVWAWLFAGMSFFAIAAYAFSTYKFVHKPLLLLVQGFRKIESGTLETQIEHERRDEFGYLYDRFNMMLKKLQSLIDQDYRQKLMMQKAELKQLQSQINPHFLYNSFFIMNSLAKTGDTERIELFTNMLGEYFRFITRNGEDNVPLLEEVRHSSMYTEIQKLRFSRRIRVQFDELPKEMELIQVPRLILQPIIENAYEHSLEKMPDEGLLRISFANLANEALITVEDNGDSLNDEGLDALRQRLSGESKSFEMTGMANIQRRILLTYGEESGLFLSRSELGGLKVVIRIRPKGDERNV